MAEEPQEITDELIDQMIARRAYDISQSDERQSDEENWHRAAREVRGAKGNENRGDAASEDD